MKAANYRISSRFREGFQGKVMSRAFRRLFRLPTCNVSRMGTRFAGSGGPAGVTRVAAAAVAAAMLGCAPITTLEGERLALRSPEFRDYVEQVFREQNRVASELTF